MSNLNSLYTLTESGDFDVAWDLCEQEEICMPIMTMLPSWHTRKIGNATVYVSRIQSNDFIDAYLSLDRGTAALFFFADAYCRVSSCGTLSRHLNV